MIAGNKFLTAMEGCEVNCTLVSHKPLLRIMHLLPENTLVDSNDIIPGMVDAQGNKQNKQKL